MKLTAHAQLLILLLSLLVAGCRGRGPAADPSHPDNPARPVVTVAPVTVGTVVQTLPVTGSLSPLPGHEATVAAPFAGTLEEVSAQPNESVVRGQVIARMSVAPLLGQMQQAQASIESAKLQVAQARVNAALQQAASRSAIAQALAQLAGDQATLANANSNLARQQKLFQDGLVSQKEVDDALLAVQTASATAQAQQQAVAAAKAGALADVARRQDIAIAGAEVANSYGALATARAQMRLAQIRAPVTGTVATVGASSGEMVDSSTTLATIVDLRDLQLTVAVPSSALGLVRPGQAVQFGTDALPGRRFGGTVASIGAQVDPSSGTVPVIVRIPNTSRLLRDDMLVSGQIVVLRRTGVLLVPRSAVLTDPDTNKASVVVVDSEGAAHVRAVRTGLTSGDDTEIVSGLAAGEQVATSGQYALPDGSKVSIRRAGAAGSSEPGNAA